MRTITGKVILPGNAPTQTARHATIEVRDASYADAPSEIIAEQHLDNVNVRPNGEIEFSLRVPEVEDSHTLTLRVHIDLNGTGTTDSGDLLTTEYQMVPASGTPAPLQARVSVI